MKGSKLHNNKIEHNHPTLFSISIFQSPEEFIALYLAIQSDIDSYILGAAKYLQKLLHRTKSPPIALTYTKQFMLLTTQSQIQLTIIRFISQLSDLSAGKSMQSSLSFIIDNSSFLTQLRHNLTHRVMVKGLVIARGKQMILKELKDKYWKVMFEKVWTTYCIDSDKVDDIFSRIGQIVKFKEFEQNNSTKQMILQQMQKSKIYNEYTKRMQNQKQSKLTSQYLFTNCQSNYEFKSLIQSYILKKVLPQINELDKNEQPNTQDSYQVKQISEHIISKYFNLQALNPSTLNIKCIIILSTLLQIILSLHKYQKSNDSTKLRGILGAIISKFILLIQKMNKQVQPNQKKTNNIEALNSPIIMKKLRQIYLLKFIKEYTTIIQALPEQITLSVSKFWQKKQQEVGKQLILQF